MDLLTCASTRGSHFSDCSLNVAERIAPENYVVAMLVDADSKQSGFLTVPNSGPRFRR
jgi:hypothetical protein